MKKGDKVLLKQKTREEYSRVLMNRPLTIAEIEGRALKVYCQAHINYVLSCDVEPIQDNEVASRLLNKEEY